MPLLSNMELRGIEIGALRKAHDDIKIVLTARLGEIPSELVEALEQISNLPRLDELLKLAATVESLGQFQQFLEQA